ncbi:sensor histidine kinase [Streptomyces aureocirculatus]|uniref:sensor histidine kinase n=1 Tax=Streptomyces aureocirculatus TaxID=67275 RepID=UPI0007C4A024|nr:HAMP domain-containing sensor histidine kinase [Streptomyces aureocirculatus]
MSIAATAWLAAQTTSGAIRQEQGQVLADDARIYDKLLDLAATRPSWRGADRTVRDLAAETGRRIALTTQDRKVIADSAGPAPKHDARLPARASAVVDPLAVDSTLAAASSRTARSGAGGSGTGGSGTGGSGTEGGLGTGTGSDAVDRIDPRAVGPFRLTASERKDLRQITDKAVGCLRERGVDAKAVEGPNGRPYITSPDDSEVKFTEYGCGPGYVGGLTPTERKALDKVNKLADACMRRKGTEPVKLGLTVSRDGAPRLYQAYVPPGAPQLVPTPALDGGEGTDVSVPDGPSRPSTKPGEARKEEAAKEEAAKEEAAKDEVVKKEEAAREEAAKDDGTYSRRLDEGARSEEAVRQQEQVDAAQALAANCVDSARREQLGPYVSSPALLFITSPDGSRPSESGFQLSGANTTRLVGLAAAVLAVTVAATAFAATRLTRPLRALTMATQRMKTGEATEPVPARSAGEISQLAAAFNDMAAHRRALEEQRKAMVSDVAHELRTPLSNIRGWLEAAEDGVVATDPELVTSLLEEALLLQHIVNDLQDLAAADAGTLRLHREPMCAVDLAEQVVAAHQARADAAGVRLTAVAEGDPWLTADPLRLRQAIGNLVSNAIRHTPEGGEVTVLCRPVDGSSVVIEVADTGTGIAAEDLPHVFDRFWRADKSRTRATGGSGLGLAIVRNLVQAHGGTVQAHSTLGKGTTFTVTLPVT